MVVVVVVISPQITRPDICVPCMLCGVFYWALLVHPDVEIQTFILGIFFPIESFSVNFIYGVLQVFCFFFNVYF